MLDLGFKWEYDVHLFTFNFIYMKAIIFATLLVCLLAATPFDKVNAIARQDECVAKTLDLIKPEIDAKVEELKQNNDLKIETDLLALIEKGKKMLDKCNENKPAIKVGDAVEWEGVAFLLASNCFKDVGVELLLADTIIQDPKDIPNDIIVSIILVLMGKQAVADCKQFEHFII